MINKNNSFEFKHSYYCLHPNENNKKPLQLKRFFEKIVNFTFRLAKYHLQH